jgi:hypothetical protein
VADVAGILSFDRGRGAALADFNLDGLLDLVEVNYGAPTRLWRNVGNGTAEHPEPMGSWIALRLAQTGANRDAIGAWVDVRVGDHVVQREVTVGGGHAGGQLGWIHFGIGTVEHVEVRVQWPDGTRSDWMTMAANTFGTIERGAATVQPWTPGQG